MIHLSFAQDYVYSQANNIPSTHVKPTNLTSKALNANYLKFFEKQILPEQVLRLHEMVAEYDIKTSADYDATLPSTYRVVFKESNSKIAAKFDHSGHIIRSNGKFSNVRLPQQLMINLSRAYPQWEFYKTDCTVAYSKDDPLQVGYQVTLKQGNKIKQLQLDPSGNSF
jgi:hypothetical protein